MGACRKLHVVVIALLIGVGAQVDSLAYAVDASQDWAIAHNGPANHQDQFNVVVEAPDGSVYAAGTTYQVGQSDNLSLVKYDAAGDQVWERAIDSGFNSLDQPQRIALDSAGNVILAGASSRVGGIYLVVWKFEPVAGGLLWEQSDLAAGENLAWSVVKAGLDIGVDDSIYVSGSSLVVARYAADGDQMWKVTPGAIDAMQGTDLVVDATGNAYVASVGTTLGGGLGIRALDPNGTLLWERSSSGHIGSVLGAAWVDLDPSGNVIMAGVPETTCGLFGLMLWKYDATGQLQWTTSYPDMPCDSFDAVGMKVDGAGDVFVVGTTAGVNYDIVTAKFDGAAGAFLWDRAHDGPAGTTDYAYDMTLDERGNVYAVGDEMFESPQNSDIVTISYDSAGNTRWIKSFAGPTAANDRGLGVAVGRCGRVYSVGYGWNPPHASDGFLIAYSQYESGDLDSDGDVDLGDFAIIQTTFGIAAGATRADGDLDGDGDVDAEDAAVLIAAQSSPCG